MTDTKRRGLAAVILSAPGHEDVAEEILSYLDWRTLLSAAQTCQAANTVVRTSARLQLSLRAAYYGHPDDFLRFDRGAFKQHPPAGTRLNRMMDVFGRWQRGSPASVHRMGESTCTRWATSSGLIAACGAQTSATTVEWNQPEHPHPSMHEAEDEDWPSQWTVWDVHHLRDVEFDPAATVPTWTVKTKHEFQDMDICREDNVVAVSSTQATRRGREWSLRVQVRCYLLEPTGKHQWKSGATVNAVPHPEATLVEATLPFSATTPPAYVGIELPCYVKLGAGGTVVISPWGFPTQEMWNWKTGKFIDRCATPTGKEQAFPVRDQGLLCLGSIPNAYSRTRSSPASHMKYNPLRQRKEWPAGKPQWMPETTYLPDLDPRFMVSAYGLAADQKSKIMMYTITGSMASTLDQSYVATHMWDRPGNDMSRPNIDVAFFDRPVYTAVCGFRAITLEGPVRPVTDRDTQAYLLHVADYRRHTRRADGVHAAPFGCKRALTAPPAARTREPQLIRYRRNKHGGRKIPFEWSETWDSSEACGEGLYSDMIVDWVPALGCPRISVELGIEDCDVVSVSADVDHLYIRHGQELTILSF